MSQFTSGTGKWFLGFIFSIYGFLLGCIIGGIAWSTGSHWSAFGIPFIGCIAFYFIYILAWYKKKEEIYRVANLSHWCDNITFLNDKGTVSIRQDRITEIIDLNASVADIAKITKKDPEFLRIKTALVSDARKMQDEPGMDIESADDEANVDELLSSMRELDEKKLAYTVSGDKDPLQFKYKYFRITNIIKPHMEWIPIVSRRELDDGQEIPMPEPPKKKSKEDADSEKTIQEMGLLEKELAGITPILNEAQAKLDALKEKGKPKEITAAKKKVIELIGTETALKSKINDLQMKIKNKGYKTIDEKGSAGVAGEKAVSGKVPGGTITVKEPETKDKQKEDEPEGEEIVDEEGDGEEEGSDDGEEKVEDGEAELDDSIEVNEEDGEGDEFEPSSEIEDEAKIFNFDDSDQKTMLDTYKKVNRLDSHRFVGRFLDFVDKCRRKGNEGVAYDSNIYRPFQVDEILKVFDINGIVTIEDLRNCDKVKIAHDIGFTADEMKEFVKYCEDETKKRTINFYKDLIPKEIRQVCLIKLSHVQQKSPEKYVYLITYAEPIELIFPKKIIASSYSEVRPKPNLKDERVPVDIKMFEQAVYELPERIESCLKFTPGGNASLFDYPVIVPLTYATFVLKGWIGTSIPIFKAIATSYDVNRELDDYKHFLSHEHILVKAMVGYMNHVKSNTNLATQHIEYQGQELDNMKDELEDQRQLRLRQLYFRSGGMASPDVIDKMWASNQQPQEEPPKKKGYGAILGTIICVLGLVILLVLLFKQ